jgi:CubicO group peptidase (beta-lactamase class C family)
MLWTMPDHGLTRFTNCLETLAAQDKFTGAVAVTRGDELVFQAAYGLANRAWGAPCTLDTRFDIASITKLFTAVATLQLIERGSIGLDTPVAEFLGLPTDAISPEVTPYHLMTHTSGIADDADEEAGELYEDLFVDRPNYAIDATADQLPNFLGKPRNFEPGAGCRYCNAGFILLGLVIEKASGQAYRQYVEANIFGPAGMDRSGFFRMDVVEPDVAEGVEPIRRDGRVVGWRRNIYKYPPVGDPAGGAYVTVSDLLAFHGAARGGKLLGPTLSAALFRPHEQHSIKDGRNHMIGYAWEFLTEPGGRILRYGKEGVNFGVSAFLRHYPEPDITLAILGVGEDAVWEPAARLDADVLGQ